MINLHNTLTSKKEPFKSINPDVVRMYSCGPTVYNYAHIGNLRAYVFTDTLKRVLKWNGYKVKQVMNVTDVGHLSSDADDGEDKMTKALKREGRPMTMEAMKEVALFYEKAFVEDLKSLNIELPDIMPRASENIDADIEIVEILIKKGLAYKTSDGIYFETEKFKDYGKLGGFNLADIKEGVRVESNPEKKSPRDFALWKFNNELGFEAPFGNGFPGWHIECSGMGRKYLGQPFDIHTGGVDHIGTHHNNEIAQSECAYDTPLANYWLHNEHLNMDSGLKMAKSGDGFITIKTLSEKNISPIAYRYYLLQAHYRTPIAFSFEALNGASNALLNLVKNLENKQGGEIEQSYKESFDEAVNDDLNTPKAIAVLWQMIADKNISQENKLKTILSFDEVLGLDIKNLINKKDEIFEIGEGVKNLLKERDTARKEKDWKKSDEIRDEIKKLGFEVKDTEKGQVLEKI